ncbi:MAG: rhomboid family intramembrane serine protease [Candidatus Sumerlaeia bacterium]|nr:rhomboid family intramembrane serine protease [Candidatus Sumerlaeia bacterium]
MRVSIRPLATWALIAVNLAAFGAILWTRWFGAYFGVSNWYEALIFANDFSRPWTLVTSLFIHGHPLLLLISLWFFYLIAPVLEERLRWYGLLALYLVGGAATTALYGCLCPMLGAEIWSLGMAPAVYALLGFYLVMYPYEEITFFYNVLFFAFTGTVGVATIHLVLFALLLNIAASVIAGSVLPGILPHRIGPISWAAESIPLLGLVMGFLAGTLRYGLEAFVGKSAVGAAASPADRMLQRALERLAADDESKTKRAGRLTRREKVQFRQALGDDAPPEEIEAFAEQCVANRRDDLLEAAYTKFRERFPERSFGPGLQATVARRFEQTGRTDLAADAYRQLTRVYAKLPAANEARFRLAKLLADDPTAVEEVFALLEEFLEGQPPREMAIEARTLLDQMIESTGRGSTYAGLSSFKPFHFGKLDMGKSPTALATPAGTPSRPDGLPIGRSSEVIIPKEPPAGDVKPSGLTNGHPSVHEIVLDSQGSTLAEWVTRPAEPDELTKAMATASSFAVILLPGKTSITSDKLSVLAEFWTIGLPEAANRLKHCRGVLLDDVPAGRAVILTRKIRGIGLPATMVPLLPDIVYPICEEVTEFNWSPVSCGNITRFGRRFFGWEQVRLVNLAQVALPGAGQTFRTVLDMYVESPHIYLRFWETTVNFGRSLLDGQRGICTTLPALAKCLNERATKALKTPAFREAAAGDTPAAFESPAELDNYNRWFLYAGFGKYAKT